jgi:hypothetical protein
MLVNDNFNTDFFVFKSKIVFSIYIRYALMKNGSKCSAIKKMDERKLHLAEMRMSSDVMTPHVHTCGVG